MDDSFHILRQWPQSTRLASLPVELATGTPKNWGQAADHLTHFQPCDGHRPHPQAQRPSGNQHEWERTVVGELVEVIGQMLCGIPVITVILLLKRDTQSVYSSFGIVWSLAAISFYKWEFQVATKTNFPSDWSDRLHLGFEMSTLLSKDGFAYLWATPTMFLFRVEPKWCNLAHKKLKNCQNRKFSFLTSPGNQHER